MVCVSCRRSCRPGRQSAAEVLPCCAKARGVGDIALWYRIAKWQRLKIFGWYARQTKLRQDAKTEAAVIHRIAQNYAADSALRTQAIKHDIDQLPTNAFVLVLRQDRYRPQTMPAKITIINRDR